MALEGVNELLLAHAHLQQGDVIRELLLLHPLHELGPHVIAALHNEEDQSDLCVREGRQANFVEEDWDHRDERGNGVGFEGGRVQRRPQEEEETARDPESVAFPIILENPHEANENHYS